VSTRRMAVDENALPPLAPEHQACRAHLLDDIGDPSRSGTDHSRQLLP
jgi:hypothetical protein